MNSLVAVLRHAFLYLYIRQKCVLAWSGNVSDRDKNFKK